MKIYNDRMSNFEMALTALFNDDDWMYAYCCEQMQKAGEYDSLDLAEWWKTVKNEADLKECQF